MEEERELQQQQDPVQEEAVPKLEEEAVSQQEPVLQQEVEEETGSLSATAEEEVRAFHKKYPGVDLSRLLAPEHSFISERLPWMTMEQRFSPFARGR